MQHSVCCMSVTLPTLLHRHYIRDDYRTLNRREISMDRERPLHLPGLASVIFLLILSVPATAAPPSDQEGQAIPEFLWWPPELVSVNEPPVFVRLDRALKADGTPDTALFDGAYLRTLNEILDGESAAPCLRTTFTDVVNSHDHSWVGYRSIVETYPNIVIARVTALGHGLFKAMPGTLLRLEAVDPLKGTDRWDHKFLFFQKGQMDLGPYHLCPSDDRLPDLPEVGDRLIVAYHRSDFPWLEPLASTLVVLKRSGQVDASAWLRRAEPRWRGESTNTVLEEVQALTGGSRGEP